MVPWSQAPACGLAHLQPFLAIEAAKLFVIHDQTLTGKKDVEPPIAEAATLRREFAQARSYSRVVRTAAAVAHGRPIGSQC